MARVLVTNIPVHAYVDGWVEVPDGTNVETMNNAIATSLLEHGYRAETANRGASNMKKLYRAWVKRTPETIAPMPSDILYESKPNGNLIGELPIGARPMPKGECGTLDRTDGGDAFEYALFTSSSGRIYVIERQS